jgi:uncharacterized protein with beta-barrel porin domain
MFAALYGPALADTTISSNTTTPLKTSTSGNITINQNVSVTVATTGAVVTIDSSNSVNNGGIIQNTQTGGGAIAVEILPGNTGNYLNNGSLSGVINVPNGGLNNIGILLAGSGAGGMQPGNATFTGDITLEKPTTAIPTFTVIGPATHTGTLPSAIGIDILSNLNGNLTVGSLVDMKGEGVTGIVTAADINGVIDITTGVNLYGTFTYTGDKVDPTSGSAMLIGGNVTQGILVEAGGALINRSTLPTLRIAPSVMTDAGGTARTIVLGDNPVPAGNGSFAGSVNLSFANHGSIQVDENNILDVSTDPGISTHAMLLGEPGSPASPPANQVLLPSGFFNIGSILSQSRSDQTFATKATNIGPTDAVGLEIGNGVTLGVFSQSGHVGADGPIVGNATAPSYVSDAIHIVLDPSASGVNNEYVGLPVSVNGETHTILAYDGTTKVATISSDPTVTKFQTIPQVGQSYSISLGAALVNGLNGAFPGQIKAGTGGAKGGSVTAIQIDKYGVVPSLDNMGNIIADASVSDPSVTKLEAYAIRDFSGTLTQINSSGNITAVVTSLTNNSQKAVAIDLSPGTTAQAISIQSGGTVGGDIIFGSYSASANQLFIDGNNGSVVSNVSGAITSNGGKVDVFISHDGNLVANQADFGGILKTSDTEVDTILVGSHGEVALALNKNSNSNVSQITATTLAEFFGTPTGHSTLTVTPTTFLPLSSAVPTSYNLIHSGQLVFAAAETATDITFPAILNGSVTCIGTSGSGGCEANTNYTDLAVTVRRKTAAELGLTGNAAAIYEPFSAAALTDDAQGAALMRLTKESDVQAAVQAAVPDISGGMRALSIAMTDQATGVIGSRQRSLVTSAAGQRSEFRFWGQEFYNNVSTPSTDLTPGYGGAGQGVSLGVEWGGLGTGRYGLGYTYFSSEETERHPRDTKTNGDWNMVTAYAGWRSGAAFFTPQLNVGMGSYLSRRLVNVVDSTTATPTSSGTILARFASARWDGYLASGGGAAGYIIDFGSFQVIPEIALDAMYVHQGAYNEFGAGGTNLSLDPQNQKSLRSFAGVLAQGAFKWNDGSLQPQLLAGWSHEFMTDPATIDGSFESTPGSRFHLVGPTLDSDRAIGGASVSYVFSNWQAGLNIDAARGQNSMTEAATLSISSRF